MSKKATTPKAPGEVKEELPTLEYKLNPETGDITRTDKDGTIRIARYFAEEKRVEIVPEWAKQYRSAAIRFLNTNEIPFESIILEGDQADKVQGDIPPCPKPTIAAGDKTPAVVEWFRKYKPAEFKARYGIRGMGTVTKTRIELNEKGEKVKVPFTVDALISDRKTHLTEKTEAADGKEGQYADE